MENPIIHDDFLLHSDMARELYHDYALIMSIINYHCHLPPYDIAIDKTFENITQAWIDHDHYKWRVMRANGLSEKYLTGDASDHEKFHKWAETVPFTMRNPLYHWTHLELKSTDIKNGELPRDVRFLGEMVQDICYHNADEYFDF